MGAAYCKAKFYGLTKTEGSRYRLVPLRGCPMVGGEALESPRTIAKDYRFSDIYDQLQFLGLVHLFDDEGTGWSYFSDGREA